MLRSEGKEMHKKSIVIMVLVAVMLVSIMPVFAAKPTTKTAKSNQGAKQSNKVAKPVTPASAIRSI